jgi:hypothetical protein
MWSDECRLRYGGRQTVQAVLLGGWQALYGSDRPAFHRPLRVILPLWKLMTRKVPDCGPLTNSVDESPCGEAKSFLRYSRHTTCSTKLKHSWTCLLAGRSGDRIPGSGEIFRTCPDRLWDPPSLLYNRYRVFLGGKAAGAWRWPPTPSNAELKDTVEI